MSAKLIQQLVSQMAEVIPEELGVCDEHGMIQASSDPDRSGTVYEGFDALETDSQGFCEQQGCTYKRVWLKNKTHMTVYLAAMGDQARREVALVAMNLAQIRDFYDEKFDKTSFIKNVILDNILPGDIPSRAKEMHIPYGGYRVVLLVRTEGTRDVYAADVLGELFPNRTKDFIVTVDDEHTAFIKEIKNSDDIREVEKTSRIIFDSLSAELMTRVSIGIGTVTESIKDLARSYKEAQMALLVGGIFESEKPVVNYNNLGIGRLIYQLPTTLCRLFLKEVFKEGSYESLDQETILTIQKFFEHNLNVSETSRQLYVHRNTLVYRLDKIQKITGLDLRNFDDAIIFKVAMLVKKYLDKIEKFG